MNTSIIIIVIGILLIVLGLYGRFGTGTTSMTALIPAFFGIPITILGILDMNSTGFVMLIITAVIAVLGAGGASNVFKDLRTGGGTPTSRASRLIMIGLCVVLLVVCLIEILV
ncbi:MAG: hypothetical protein AAGD96_03055 [Chloroflexota bacterium]